ncbi:hypothetical protein GWI33_017772 [Rhynchophorus ferrugineus]|uniref:Mos1 transposase HTH domain-containing protein n=1 Tax=Rhynchophorus ferrugineus TaxID=354439 RepID=A0A834I8L7_RHYFE|nr:hypothetical protein GWI33_017772 [Rhynchophorus ferrugineus]
MDQKLFRVLILRCFLLRKNTVQAKQWLEKYYEDSAPSETTIKRWCSDFKRGRKDTDDAEHSGRPNEVWVALLLTVDQKKERVDDSEQCLAIFKRNIPEILHRHVTKDETRIHHFTPTSKQSSFEWTAIGDRPILRQKINRSTKVALKR